MKVYNAKENEYGWKIRFVWRKTDNGYIIQNKSPEFKHEVYLSAKEMSELITFVEKIEEGENDD